MTSKKTHISLELLLQLSPHTHTLCCSPLWILFIFIRISGWTIRMCVCETNGSIEKCSWVLHFILAKQFCTIEMKWLVQMIVHIKRDLIILNWFLISQSDRKFLRSIYLISVFIFFIIILLQVFFLQMEWNHKIRQKELERKKDRKRNISSAKDRERRWENHISHNLIYCLYPSLQLNREIEREGRGKKCSTKKKRNK